jgi:hypothetical protein
MRYAVDFSISKVVISIRRNQDIWEVLKGSTKLIHLFFCPMDIPAWSKGEVKDTVNISTYHNCASLVTTNQGTR